MLGELVVLAVTLLGCLLWLGTRKPKNFPPGPPRLPIIGSLTLYLTGKGRPGNKPNLIHGVLQNIEKYGPVFGFYVGMEPTCVIADYDTLREVLKQDGAAGRPSFLPFTEYRPGHHAMLKRDKAMLPGIVFSQGPYWSEQKRFVLQNLKKFGLSKSLIEDRLLNEVGYMCAHLATFKGQAVALSGKTNVFVLNALWSIITGERLQTKGPKMEKILYMVDQFSKERIFSLPPLISVLPHWILRKKMVKFNAMSEAFCGTLMNEVVDIAVEKNASNLEAENIENVTNAYLAEVEKCSDPSSSFYRERGMASLNGVLLDLFLAGIGAVPFVLDWAALFMIHHPEIKQKVHQEIDNVVASSTPRLEHRDHLPYTNAVLLECLRMSSLVPLSVPQATLKEVKVKDYVLPAGTTILSSLISIMHCPKHFPEPHVFRPDRFLSADGSFEKDSHVIPFSVGKRSCMAQGLAEKELFIFFAGMMQKFDFSNPPGQQLPSYHINDHADNNPFRKCPNFEVLITPRDGVKE